ncbi:hypothetical protein V8G54_020482 [Vigna mungo]|uniref:Uncharacterized protein n=1 Tax=Vigna mungo TaxID=3915 RepID=A0AAQ3NCL4_VIGMU
MTDRRKLPIRSRGNNLSGWISDEEKHREFTLFWKERKLISSKKQLLVGGLKKDERLIHFLIYKGVYVSNEAFQNTQNMGFVLQGNTYINREDAGILEDEDEDHSSYSLESLSRKLSHMSHLQAFRHEEVCSLLRNLDNWVQVVEDLVSPLDDDDSDKEHQLKLRLRGLKKKRTFKLVLAFPQAFEDIGPLINSHGQRRWKKRMELEGFYSCGGSRFSEYVPKVGHRKPLEHVNIKEGS